MSEYPLLNLKSALYYTLWQLERANKNECKIPLNMINKIVWGLWIKGSNYIVAFFVEKAETIMCSTSWEINKLTWLIKRKNKNKHIPCYFHLKVFIKDNYLEDSMSTTFVTCKKGTIFLQLIHRCGFLICVI